MKPTNIERTTKQLVGGSEGVELKGYVATPSDPLSQKDREMLVLPQDTEEPDDVRCGFAVRSMSGGSVLLALRPRGRQDACEQEVVREVLASTTLSVWN